MKLTFIGILILIFNGLSYSSFAAAASSASNASTTIETKSTNWLSTFKHVIKKNARTLKEVTTKKVHQFKKEYREKSSIQKVGLGIGMILVGVLVTLGSILTLSGWGFVIGLGLVIFGALKIVVGVLGVVF
jgi:hypothetical protein